MKKINVDFYNKNTRKGNLKCEIAKTIFEKTKGLMYREKLSEKNGMLFTFSVPLIRLFWMKNVRIPLDIIFVNRKKRIIKIYEAPVEKNIIYKLYWSHGFCKYVIETNRSFCKKHNINKNDKIRIS